MNNLERVLENPAVRNGGKVGLVAVAASVIYFGGKWVVNKTASFRKEIRAEFDRVRKETREAREAEVSVEA